MTRHLQPRENASTVRGHATSNRARIWERFQSALALSQPAGTDPRNCSVYLRANSGLCNTRKTLLWVCRICCQEYSGLHFSQDAHVKVLTICAFWFGTAPVILWNKSKFDAGCPWAHSPSSRGAWDAAHLANMYSCETIRIHIRLNANTGGGWGGGGRSLWKQAAVKSLASLYVDWMECEMFIYL